MQQAIDSLVAVYRDKVQPHMRELPVYNPALQVEARGFALRAGHCSGVLITPWCMNLVLLPGAADERAGLVPGSRVEVAFPGGTCRLTQSLPAGGQPHLALALFTTVLDFPDQPTARRVADEVLLRLYQASAQPDSDCGDPLAAALDQGALHRPLSRRDVLRGRLAPAAGREA